ncbi:MAG: bifunctional nuclease family protein [Chloroflexota bacterium]
MSDFVEVVIDSVRVSLMSPQRMVILKQVNAERYLPVWVGPYEAEAITVGLQEVEMIRPLTHDLLKNVFGLFNARIKRIEIVSLRDDIYYGNIVAEVNEHIINVDARPSDSIALAVRAHATIWVHESVMEQAAIVPEQDIQETPPIAREKGKASAQDMSDERLSIFEDFLNQLDIDDKDKPDKPDKPEDDKDEPDKT